jgi:hypothetical protein
MIIKLSASKIFTQHPAERFAEQHEVPPALWTEMWRRHTLLEYTMRDLADYFEIKTGKKIETQYIRKWLFRTKVYVRANEAVKMGAQAVTSEYFGDLEGELVQYLLRNAPVLKKPPKILV